MEKVPSSRCSVTSQTALLRGMQTPRAAPRAPRTRSAWGRRNPLTRRPRASCAPLPALGRGLRAFNVFDTLHLASRVVVYSPDLHLLRRWRSVAREHAWWILFPTQHVEQSPSPRPWTPGRSRRRPRARCRNATRPCAWACGGCQPPLPAACGVLPSYAQGATVVCGRARA